MPVTLLQTTCSVSLYLALHDLCLKQAWNHNLPQKKMGLILVCEISIYGISYITWYHIWCPTCKSAASVFLYLQEQMAAITVVRHVQAKYGSKGVMNSWWKAHKTLWQKRLFLFDLFYAYQIKSRHFLLFICYNTCISLQNCLCYLTVL